MFPEDPLTAGSAVAPATLVDLLGDASPRIRTRRTSTSTTRPSPTANSGGRARAMRRGSRRFGVDRGDKVCLIYPTCAEFFYTFFGALRLGAIPVPLYPTLGVDATASIFRDSEASVVATIGWFRRGVDESQSAAANVRHVVEPTDLEVDDRVARLPGDRPRRHRVHPVHVGQHRPAARRRAEPRQRGRHGGRSWPRPPSSRATTWWSRGSRSTTTWG